MYKLHEITTKGVATFSGLIINVAYTYLLTPSVDSLQGQPFTLAVAPAAAKQVIWQDAPSSTATAGIAVAPSLVAVEDAFGNLVTANTTVTMKLVGGKFSTGSATMTATTNNGFATFSGFAINTAGTYALTAAVGSATTSSQNLTVSPAAASKLVLQTAPVAKAVAGTTLSPVIVAVEDTYGNVVTSNNSTITLTLNSGIFSTGSATVTATAVNGIATFSSLAINTTGTYTVTASGGDSLTTTTSGNLVISPAAFSSLAIQQNPTTGTAGVALAPAIKVAALDQFGNLVTANTTVTLTLTSGTFSSGKTTVTASTTGGIATFSNLIIKTAGNYVLTASADTQSGPSFNLTVSPAAASKLVWKTAPVGTAITGTTLSPIVVAVEDAFGNVVTTDNSTITLTLNIKTFSSNLSTVTATVVNGIATFADLVINVLGTYKITASDSNSLTSITSGNLVITASV